MGKKRCYVLEEVTRSFTGHVYGDTVTIRDRDNLIGMFDIFLGTDELDRIYIEDYADFRDWLLNTPVYPPEDGEVHGYQWLAGVVNEYDEELAEELRFVRESMRELT